MGTNAARVECFEATAEAVPGTAGEAGISAPQLGQRLVENAAAPRLAPHWPQ
ncbi:MAG: hypothetical protein ACLQUY_24735 [Ktedonobacterales bacterium]